MKELNEILSALLILNEQLSARVPLWFAVITMLGIAVAAYAWLAQKVMGKEVLDFTRLLVHVVRRCAYGVAAVLTWLSARPDQMFVGVGHAFWRRLIAIDLMLLGAVLGLMLLPPLWTSSQVLALPEHPRFFWAGPVVLVEFYLLHLCVQLVRAGWKNATS